MLVHEAQWIGARLNQRSQAVASLRLLNIGSSTESFRSVEQPYIDELIFKPLRMSGRHQVIHCDLKEAPGVDVCADFMDNHSVATLEALRCNVFLVSNLLEHVTDVPLAASQLRRLVKPGQTLILTGPLDFPYHPDPIDNMFRPSRQDVEALMQGFTMLEWDVVRHFNTVTANRTGFLRRAAGTVATARNLLPRPVGKGGSVRDLQGVSAWCATLVRDTDAG